MATEDLGLQLVGTVVAENPWDSLAIIEDRSTGKQYPRREGDRVGKRAVVKKILRNRVVIDAGSGEVMLVMGHSQSSGSPPAGYQGVGGRVPESTKFYASVVRDQDLNIFLPKTYDRKDVDAYFADLDRWRKLHVDPAGEGNSAGGFVITHIQRGSVPWRMGLRSGDAIKSVNGEVISGPDEVGTFFNTLKRGGEISVGIERESEAQELQISVPVASAEAAPPDSVPPVEDREPVPGEEGGPGAEPEKEVSQ
jgi:hypothetical protein